MDTSPTLAHIRNYFSYLEVHEIRQALGDLSISEIVDFWPELDEEEAIQIFLFMNPERRAELINNLPLEDQEYIIKALSLENSKTVFSEMEPDDLVDLIQEVSPEVREAVWNSLTQEAKQETQFLLRFDEDDAAGIMTPRYLAMRSTATVEQAVNYIRQGANNIETVYYIYVLDNLKRLLGVVSLREVLSAPDNTKIEDIMIRKVISVRETTDQEETAKILEENSFIALPVVDKYQRMLGIVTFDDVIDVIREEQTEDMYKMGAMGGDVQPYLETSVLGLIWKRIPWLTFLLLAGTLSTNLIASYEGMVAGAAGMLFITIFLPVITQTGGNSGTQSSTLMIRGLATGEIQLRDAGRIIGKEILVGVLMGLALGLIIFLRSVFLPPGVTFMQGLAVSISIALVTLVSTLLGTLAPLLINKLGFDPTVMAGPLMSTAIDLVGIFIYFETAKIILGM